MTAALFAIVSVLTGGASLFAKSAWLRAGAYCAFVVVTISIWFGSLGHARPALPGITPSRGTVIAFRLDEPRAIYVWLGVAGRAEPLSLQLPWNTNQARSLEQAQAAAKRTHGTIRMNGHPGRAGDRSGIAGNEKAMFYPAPPAPLPVKAAP